MSKSAMGRTRRGPFTLVVSGNDTGVGKTHVAGLVARALAARGLKVEIVKAVETGGPGPESGDAARAAAAARSESVTFRTLLRFRRPIAPLAAARAEGRRLSLNALLRRVGETRAVDCRIIEGAGGLAVPIDPDGSDWADFARMMRADATLLVVEDRLGAINQARLLASYAEVRRAPRPVFLLNRIRPAPAAVRLSNRSGLRASGLTVFTTPQSVAAFVARAVIAAKTAG
jgi:dethiobiotin synthetase